MRGKAKKLLCAALALAMLFSLSACQGTTPGESEEGEYQTIELTMAVNGTDTQIDARVGDYFAELGSMEAAAKTGKDAAGRIADALGPVLGRVPEGQGSH